jgi:hypothetical protein
VAAVPAKEEKLEAAGATSAHGANAPRRWIWVLSARKHRPEQEPHTIPALGAAPERDAPFRTLQPNPSRAWGLRFLRARFTASGASNVISQHNGRSIAYPTQVMMASIQFGDGKAGKAVPRVQ